MTPRTWAYGDVEGDDEPVRDRPYESFGQQGFGLPTYAGGPDRGAERVDLGEPVAPNTATGPKAWQRRDDRIRDEVCSHLEADGHVDASDLEVIVHQGEVIVSGTVRDRGQRDRALHIADWVNGVVDVVNRIRVVPGTEGDRSGGDGGAAR
jgi:hypothetical protein